MCTAHGLLGGHAAVVVLLTTLVFVATLGVLVAISDALVAVLNAFLLATRSGSHRWVRLKMFASFARH